MYQVLIFRKRKNFYKTEKLLEDMDKTSKRREKLGVSQSRNFLCFIKIRFP